MKREEVRSHPVNSASSASGVAALLATLIYVVCASWLVGVIAHEAFTTRVVTNSPGTDYWEHSATLRALMDHPFSRNDPFTGLAVGSTRMMPHYLAVALASRAFGLDVLGAMGVASSVNALLLVVGIFVFFRVCFRDYRAPLLGLLVMLGAWWEGWHFSNVYQLWVLFSVSAYPSTAALGYTLLTLAAAIITLKKSSPAGWCLLTGLLAANTLLTHLLTAMVPLSGCFLLAAAEPGVRMQARLRLAGAVLAGILATHFWPYYSPIFVALGGSGRLSGWVASSAASATATSSVHTLHEFYKFDDLLRTMGLGLPAVFLASCMVALRRRPFVGLGAFAMALPFVANVFVSIPLGHRYILLSLVYLHIALVWGLLMVSDGYARSGLFHTQPWLRRGAALGAAVVLIIFVSHNLTLAQERLRFAESRRRDSAQIRIAREVSRHVPPGGCVMATPLEGWPLPTYGTQVVAAYHENPLVFDGNARLNAANAFFRPGASEGQRIAWLREWKVTHVLLGPGAPRDLWSFLSTRGRNVASTDGRTLYALTTASERD